MPEELPCFVDDHTRTATWTDPRRAFAVVHLSTGSLTFKGGECDLHPLAACTSLTTTLEQLLGTTRLPPNVDDNALQYRRKFVYLQS